MTSRREDREDREATTTGASEAYRRTDRRRDDRYLDGLFTYCLSVVCEHDAAVAALGETLAVAQRRGERGRVPAESALYRSWLYALARWSCTHRLGSAQPPTESPALTEAEREQRRRQLAALAWPEASGQPPAQREALELAVRHGLGAREVAAVLSLPTQEASALVSHASCEVERTRAALAVVESGGCPAVGGLAGDERLLLGTPLRRELIRHIDDCDRCRRAAERAMSGVRWPGTAPTSARLTMLKAPREEIDAALEAALRARARRTPRFERTGFPVHEGEREARRERLRGRAVTTTVVAAVLAAPVLALWAAWRGAPQGEAQGPASASGLHERDLPYEKAGQAGPPGKKAPREHRVSVAVSHPGGDTSLATRAVPRGDGALLTLTARGADSVRWSVSSEAAWLRIAPSQGVLEPGESATVRVAVDRTREPTSPWTATLRVAPSGATVTVGGDGAGSASEGGSGSSRPAHPSTGGDRGHSGNSPQPGGSPSRPTSPPGSGPAPSEPPPTDGSDEPENPPESPGEEEPSDPPPSPEEPPPSDDPSPSPSPSTLPADS